MGVRSSEQLAKELVLLSSLYISRAISMRLLLIFIYLILFTSEKHVTVTLLIFLVKSIRSIPAYLAETLYYAMKVSAYLESSN